MGSNFSVFHWRPLTENCLIYLLSLVYFHCTSMSYKKSLNLSLTFVKYTSQSNQTWILAMQRGTAMNRRHLPTSLHVCGCATSQVRLRLALPRWYGKCDPWQDTLENTEECCRIKAATWHDVTQKVWSSLNNILKWETSFFTLCKFTFCTVL